MKIEDLYAIFSESYLVDTDTRKIREGSLFFALKGENFNGNDYALEALEKGASYAIIDEDIKNEDPRLILVGNVLKVLQELANYHRKQLHIRIIALTGSNGKTTTKELINLVLSKKYTTVATQGNLNNHIGVPLTLLNMGEDVEMGIVEMGANHLKEIELLSSIVEPDYGYITNFGKAHLEGFGSVRGVIEGKSELYENIIKNRKQVFVNPDDPIQMKRTESADRILFDNFFTLVNTDPFITLSFDGDVIKTKLVGSYNYPNILAAITMGIYFEVPKKDIINAIMSYTPDNNRSQIIKTPHNDIILDAYNANPTSVEAAINSFKKSESQEKAVILGDMFELGGDSQKEHQNIVDLLSELNFSRVFLIGENYHETKCAFHKFKEFEDFSEYLNENKLQNQHILIKGSRGMQLERVLDLID